jgi:hypothetical protein
MKESGDISEMISNLKDSVKDTTKVETAEDVHTSSGSSTPEDK